MEHTDTYYQRLVSAMVRGSLREGNEEQAIFATHLDDLTDDQHEELLVLGNEQQLKTKFFQRAEATPATKKVLDILRGIVPDNVLDIGSGRGGFIWRLLDEYKSLPITAIDHSPQRVESISAVIRGGVQNLSAKQLDARDLSAFPAEMFDVSTVLKVLEYIDDVEQALAEICRVTKRFIIILFPAHRDNDPEKKHFFDKEQLEQFFHQQDIMQIRFEALPNYHLLIARK